MVRAYVCTTCWLNTRLGGYLTPGPLLPHEPHFEQLEIEIGEVP